MNCPVIEDCAQAIGGYHKDNTPLGSKGDISILSFAATKLLPAGEGGACITKDAGLADRIRKLRNCDEQKPDPKAFNFKLSDIHAVLALEKLKALNKNIISRTETAGKYDAIWGSYSFRVRFSRTQPVAFRYLIHTDSNKEIDSIINNIQAKGIICRRPIWKAIHHSAGGTCPNTNKLEKKLISVPIYPGLSNEEIETICTVAGRELE
jgi:perosamine synthetase